MRRAFTAIQKHYGELRAERSGVPLINHIKEGLIILDQLGAGCHAKDAFCLHPIVQADDDLRKNYHQLTQFDAMTNIFVMEYRNVANAWLSDKVFTVRGTPTMKSVPKLSPLAAVNQMLIADKVQNHADFMVYHYGKHERSDELAKYFEAWLHALDVSDEQYVELVAAAKKGNP